MIALPTTAITNDYFSTLLYLFRHAQRKHWLLGPHHIAVAEALEKVFSGEIKRLIINMPPRYSKTEMIIGFIAWALGREPDSEFIYTSYSDELAVKSSYGVRSIVQSDVFTKLFPGFYLKDDSQAKDFWQTMAGGVMYATGTQGTITGFGAGKERQGFGGAFIIDDPIKASEFNSKTQLKNSIEWYQSTVTSRLNRPKSTPIIVIAQRLAEEDLCGFLLNGGSGDKWEHICFPALKDDDTPLWPAKHSIESLKQMREANKYHFYSQYQQNPIPLGGGVIHEEWWRYYDTVPELEFVIIAGDTAQKIKERNDFSVFGFWGKAKGARQAYLLDLVRGKWEAPELLKVFKEFYLKNRAAYKCPLLGVYIEDKSSGTGLMQHARREYSIPVTGVRRDIDKYTAVLGVTPFISCGMVFLPKYAPFTKEFVAESTSFKADMSHKHDDQVDMSVYALEKIFNEGHVNISVL